MTCLRSTVVGIVTAMISTGLVSVTFRALDVPAVIALTHDAGLRGITWGGDIHVPSGNLAVAREAGRMTTDAGLWTEGYGSYYAAGTEPEKCRFERDLETAIALGAPRIRLWAGKQASLVATERDREDVAADLRRCAEIARAANVAVALEFHSHSLTDTAESAAALMRAVNRDGGAAVRLYWQPPNGMPKAEALSGMQLVLPWVDNVHVFHWLIRNEEQIRLPLSEGADVWPEYFQALEATKRDRCALLEFVRGDEPAQFLADARQLRQWLCGI